MAPPTTRNVYNAASSATSTKVFRLSHTEYVIVHTKYARSDRMKGTPSVAETHSAARSRSGATTKPPARGSVPLAKGHEKADVQQAMDVAWTSSPIADMAHWRSPVLLIQGDDDRNVAFQQMTGLVQLLRQRDVYFELIVFPDDVHESLLHSRWMYTLGRMETFLHRFLWETPAAGGK